MIRELTGRLSPSAEPDWCEGGHHCTAHTMPAGEHASRPEVWKAGNGTVVATRYADRAGAGHLELRFVVALPVDEHTAQALCRHLIAVGHLMLSRVLGGAVGGRR